MFWKIIISIILLLIAQIADYIAIKYFSNLATVNSIASWNINLPIISIYILTIIALIALIIIGNTLKPRWPLPILIILAGGLSNLIDRIFYCGVIDYFDIKIIPIFNVADILITVGVIWLALIILLPRSRHNREQVV